MQRDASFADGQWESFQAGYTYVAKKMHKVLQIIVPNSDILKGQPKLQGLERNSLCFMGFSETHSASFGIMGAKLSFPLKPFSTIVL